MNNLIESVIKKDQFWPTLISLLIPLVQLFAVVIVDINSTLRLNELFIYADLLPVANLLALMLIAASIGVYWYRKENYNWLVWGEDSKQTRFPQKEINTALFTMIIIGVITCLIIITSLILGKSGTLPVEYKDTVAIVQIISYIVFVISIGIVAYIGLSEYSKKQRDFKPEQYLNNLLSSMQFYGTIPRPTIHIKQRTMLQGNQLQILVNLEIGDDEKYLITNYDGKEIIQELPAEEYRRMNTQPIVAT
jgi:hypothetical protein